MNSGNSRAAVSSYLRRNRVSWPTIVDANRSFEKQNDVPQVSLKNVMQMQILTADGKLFRGNPGKLAAEADRALEGAKWNVDPTEIPKVLKSTWSAVEFGNFPPAATPLKRHLKSKNAAVKSAAEKLQAYIQEQLDSRKKAADADLKAEKPWAAYKGYVGITASFKGFEVPADVSRQVKTLAATDAVKTELAARKKLQTATRIATKSLSSRKRAIVLLKKLIDDYPDTEATGQAKKMLEGVAAP